MTRFVVDLGDVKMSKSAQAQMSANIQKTVLTNLAELQLEEPTVLGFPRDWLGLILRRDFDQFKIAEKQITELIRR